MATHEDLNTPYNNTAWYSDTPHIGMFVNSINFKTNSAIFTNGNTLF